METSGHVFEASRDWIEWVVDIGGIVAGLASLVASDR
jgi:hypothetical protein